jgi:hypothetical protein
MSREQALEYAAEFEENCCPDVPPTMFEQFCEFRQEQPDAPANMFEQWLEWKQEKEQQS